MLMQAAIALLRRGGQTQQALPDTLRRYFFHLYWDMAWMGIVAGSSQSFLGVYVARLGADPLQLGLINAGPALVGLLFTMPAGIWLRRRAVGRAVFWAAALTRIHFLLWALLPLLLPAAGQIWSYVAIVLFMTIPGTVLAVGFNAVYASAVPPDYRGQVAGTRNAVLSLVFIATSLFSGFILERLPMTPGYVLIFALGFVGAAMSTYHLWHLRQVATEVDEPDRVRSSLGDYARPGDARGFSMNLRTTVALRVFTRGVNLLQVDVLRGSYGRIIAAFFAFHFAQYLPIPVFPIYWVDTVHFTDWEIGLATAGFHSTVLFGSLWFMQLTRRWSNRHLCAVGAILLSSYPFLTALTTDLTLFMVTSLLGGLAWAMVAGALGNYLLEQVPETNRPAYLAWYNLALNAAVLSGSLLGSLLAGWIGLTATLVVAGVLRFFAGIAIWRWH